VVSLWQPWRTGPDAGVTACFGGGGFFALAFNIGVAEGLAEAGIDVRRGVMLGTSGGAWASGALATGAELGEVVDTCYHGKTEGRPLSAMTYDLLGDSRDERVRTTAVELRSGRRHVLRGEVVGVAAAVAASAAAPGLFTPQLVGSRRYIDGGMYSPTAAHLAPSARLLVTVAPMAGPLLGPVGAWWSRQAAIETRAWRLRHGGQVLLIQPGKAMAAVAGRGFRILLNHRDTEAIRRSAREVAAVRGERFLARHPELQTTEAAAGATPESPPLAAVS
jgi:hypothetical protein